MGRMLPESLKMSLKKSAFVMNVIAPIVRNWRARAVLRRWENAGRPVPPPQIVKIDQIRRFANPNAAFVETGTLFGDTLGAVHKSFARSVSVELDPTLHAVASRRFRRCPDVVVLQGDSGKVVPQILAMLNQPAVFWLDAHYSGGFTARGEIDTPLMVELVAILRHAVKGHVVLIDDAREMGTNPAYPTLQEVTAAARAHWGAATKVEVQDDVVTILR